ncbi:MAG TPA: GMC family oxidoreductase [Steroidobacteraceae bacterium]
MFLDANDLPNDQQLSAHICIVGGGAAGLTIALEFAGTDIDVLLLESGGFAAEKDTQALYAGTVANEALHSPPDRYRQRRFGGTTTIWGGRCVPFDDIDFEPREYIPHSGWPLARALLMPYYARANRLCEAGAFAYTVRESFDSAVPPMIEGFESSHFTTDTLERFSCPTDFGVRYVHRLRAASNVRVLLHANVTALQLNSAGTHTDELLVKTLRGKRFKVRAQQFVLAAGGLEVARLLLSSRDVHPGGIGNNHDVVGRYYMCHIAGTVGELNIDRPLGAVWHGYDVSNEGIYCRRRLALRPDVQRSHAVGNFIARLHHPRITNPEHRNAMLSLLYLAKFAIPYEYAKRLTGDERAGPGVWWRHLRNVLRRPFDALGFAAHLMRHRLLAERKFPSIIVKPRANLFSIDFHAEQWPNQESRVSLSDEKDSLGMPKLLIDWRYSAGDVATVSRALELLARDVRSSGIGRLDYDPASIELEMIRYGAYGGHHIGTARMGTDPHCSVVDANCMVHGIDNLHVAGSAVFPTSSQANPTLTVVALALRAAAHLATALGP